MRLFVGARVSVSTANALAGAAETLARRARDAGADIRWVPAVNYHVTLKFLGSTRAEAVAAVVDVLERATVDTPNMTIKTMRLGAFPSLDKARVVWAGVQDLPPLAELARRIEDGCAGIGYAREPRAFHAHVTLGRVRETRPLREVVLPLAEQMFGDTRIDAISLFESETKSTGSVYRELQRIAFKSPENRAERQTATVLLDAREPATDTDDGWPRGHVPNSTD